MYIIRPEGHEGPTRTLHRNNLRCCPVHVSQEEDLERKPPSSQPQTMTWYPVAVAPLIHQYQPTGHTHATAPVVVNSETDRLAAVSGMDPSAQPPIPVTEEMQGEPECQMQPETMSCLPSPPTMSPTGELVRQSQRSSRGQPPARYGYT